MTDTSRLPLNVHQGQQYISAENILDYLYSTLNICLTLFGLFINYFKLFVWKKMYSTYRCSQKYLLRQLHLTLMQ